MAALARLRAWELNPVVVKELRQAVRSWAVTGMLLLFLAVLFFTMLGMLVGSSVMAGGPLAGVSGGRQALGRDIVQVFLPILTLMSLLFIPLYVAVRLAAERSEHNVDLLYITTLSPARIIRGKLMCGIYLTVLFFSVCLPFLVFTNLLRGVDLPTIFIALSAVFLADVLAIQAAIFLACLPATRGFKILIALPVIGFGISCVVGLTGMSFFMLQSGVGSRLGSWSFWGDALTAVLLGGLTFGLLHVASIAMISPASSNRTMPVRVYITASWFIGGATALGWFIVKGWIDPIEAWMAITMVFVVLMLLLGVSEGDERSVRVARAIPTHPARRWIAFFFYNGSAGGLAWATLLGAVTLGFMWLLSEWFNDRSITPATVVMPLDFLQSSTAVFAYTLAYCLAGLFLHRRFFPQRGPMMAGLLAMLVPALWAVLPNLALFFMNKLTWDTLQQRQLGSVFNVFALKDTAHLSHHLAFSLCFALLMAAVNVPWFLKQVRAFKTYVRPENPAPPPLPVK